MQPYYELMVLTQREKSEEDWRPGVKYMHLQDEFESGDELDKIARKGEIDSESQTVATAIVVSSGIYSKMMKVLKENTHSRRGGNKEEWVNVCRKFV